MRPSVTAAWPRVAREHEGVCAWPYADTRGLVTIGVGSLFDDGTGDPPQPFLALPWTTGGHPAPRTLIASGWRKVKARRDLYPRGGGAFRDVTTLRLDGRTIDGLLMARTREFWAVLTAQLVNLDTWPADAQLALLDMAYQLGSRFMGPGWPRFTAAAHAANFQACSLHSAVRQASPGRNRRRARWFANAADVAELGLDRARLWDDETPKAPDQEEDGMAITEERFREIIREELTAVLPLIWRSRHVDIIKAPTATDQGNTLTPATVLEELRRKGQD